MSKTLEQIQIESSKARSQTAATTILQTIPISIPITESASMNDFAKWWTIFNMVWTIVANFTNAGGPTVNPLIVANEVTKELVRKVDSGFLPKDVLMDMPKIIQAAIDSHPAIQNIPMVK